MENQENEFNAVPKKQIVMLDDMKTVDVCGFEGTSRGHFNGVRNLRDDKK